MAFPPCLPSEFGVRAGILASPAPEAERISRWLRNARADEGEGLTWGHDADLMNPDVGFTLRIDLVLVRPGGRHRLGRVAAEVWGDDPLDRTSSGLWPSDHGGVSVWLELPGRRPSIKPED